MLVMRTGKEMDPHWTDSAENVICAFIAYICALEGDPAARNLAGRADTDHLAGKLHPCPGGDAATDRIQRRAGGAGAFVGAGMLTRSWAA